MSQTKVEAPFVENNRPFRNIIINGDMSISQRGTSFASMGNVDSQYTLDRWKFTEEGDFGAAEITVTQDTDVPTGEGFAKSLKCVCATVDTSIDSGTISYMEQRIEGQNLQHVSKGTSGAKKMTYSFFCKSNLTGTFTINFLDSDNTRQFSTSYSLASANTWERIIINIPADTTGAFTNDNGDSLIVQMNLQAGTSKSNGALTTAFEASAQGDRGVGQTNFFSSTSNNWYITGVQWEVGDTATDFEHLPIDIQLHRCQRYCQKFDLSDSNNMYGIGRTLSSNRVDIWFPTKIEMRAAVDAITDSLTTTTIYRGDGTRHDSTTQTATALVNANLVAFGIRKTYSDTIEGDNLVATQMGGTLIATCEL